MSEVESVVEEVFEIEKKAPVAYQTVPGSRIVPSSTIGPKSGPSVLIVGMDPQESHGRTVEEKRLSDTKFCSKCGEERPRSEFRIKNKERGYLAPLCKTHQSEEWAAYQKKRRQEDPEKLKAIGLASYRRNFNKENNVRRRKEETLRRTAREREVGWSAHKKYVEENKEKINAYCRELAWKKRIAEGRDSPDNPPKKREYRLK